MANGDAYRDLAKVCRRRKLRLLLVGDYHRTPMKLTRIDVLKGDDLMARVSLREHKTLDDAAVVALTALEEQKEIR